MALFRRHADAVLTAVSWERSQADVHWPSYTLMEDECVEARHAVYVGVFEEPHGEGPGKTRKAELDEATWRTLEVGASYHLGLGPLGGVKAVTPAAP